MTRRVVIAASAVLLAACGGSKPATSPSVTFAPPPSSTPASSTSGTSTGTGATSTSVGSPTSTTVATTGEPTSTTSPAVPSTPAARLEPVVQVDNPLDVGWRAGDDTAFVVGQGGTIIPVRGGTAGSPVLDITNLTGADGERGLLGLTFALDGGHAYIDYTDRQGNTIIAEYAVGADGVFDAGSRRQLLEIDQPYANHNGGNVTIGPDGMLYIGMGDGGAAGDPERRALVLTSLLGKILRIDPTPSGGRPYTVPADNPFVGIDGAKPEIWSVGVRNPWRFSFDPATHDLWVADVGQNLWEEVDVAAADPATKRDAGRGVDFGWSAFEGTHPFNDDQAALANGALMPVYEYPHGDDGCSISGGARYRGTAIPALAGWYVFSDYCSGHLTALRVVGDAATGITVSDHVLLAEGGQVSSVRAAPDGELWVTTLTGQVSRVVPA